MEKRRIAIGKVQLGLDKWNRLRDKILKKTMDENEDYLFKQLERYEKKICNPQYYEKQWEVMQFRYKRIELYGIQCVSIGETFVRLYQLICDIQKNNDNSVLKVVLPVFSSDYCGAILYNARMFEIFRKYLCIIDDTNINLWKYIVKFHREKLSLNHFTRYYARVGQCTLLDDTMPVICFSESEGKEAREKMLKMGLQGEYICLHARDNGTKGKEFGEGRAERSSARNCDINSLKKASLYIREQNMHVVRMGKFEDQICNIPDILDYANKYQDDLLDFYLLANCKFMIGSDSGLTTVALYWRTPVLMINTLGIVYGYEGQVYTETTMYIPKKFYSEKKQRYLNLYEICDMENKCDWTENNVEYVKYGIAIQDNTEEEIYLAVKEMNDRLAGVWKESEEEKNARNKYWKIMNLWKEKHSYVLPRKKAHLRGYSMCPYNISWNFLKDNLYLLDCD